MINKKIIHLILIFKGLFCLISCSEKWYQIDADNVLDNTIISYNKQRNILNKESNFLNAISINPDWSNVFQSSDSLLFIGVYVTDSAQYVTDERENSYALSNRMFLTASLSAGEWNFNTNLLIPVEGSTQEGFTGTLITSSTFSNEIGYANYRNGKYMEKKSDPENSLKVAGTWITANCRSVTVTFGGGSYTSSVVCDYIYLDAGGGNGGGGGKIKGPLPSLDPKIPADGWGVSPSKFKLTKKPSKDPCAGRAAVNERANLDSAKIYLNKIINLTENDTVEYAYETVMTDTYNKILKNTAIRTDGKKTEVNWKMNWGTSGITVGFVHSHPFESAPTPRDLFQGTIGYNQIQPASQKTIFVDYFTSTIVTSNYIYMVTVKDANKWIEMGTNFEQKMDTGWNQYLKLRDDYLKNNRNAPLSESQEYALLQLYSDIVNIYRSDKGAILDFKPLNLESSNNKPGFKNCNP